jgi:carbonic anhydrase
MDSRLFPEAFLGLNQGDAEVIRNGGGRVTEDVIRSMIICQDMLECNTVLVIHHTDCGGQHAVFHPAAVVEHAKHLAKHVLDVGEGGINMQVCCC